MRDLHMSYPSGSRNDIINCARNEILFGGNLKKLYGTSEHLSRIQLKTYLLTYSVYKPFCICICQKHSRDPYSLGCFKNPIFHARLYFYPLKIFLFFRFMECNISFVIFFLYDKNELFNL